MCALRFSHDTVMQLVLLFDVGMVATGPLAAFTVVTAEDGGQLLLGHPVGWKGDGAFLCQAPTVLQSHHTEDTSATGFTSAWLLEEPPFYETGGLSSNMQAQMKTPKV